MRHAYLWRRRRFRTFVCAGSKGRICIAWPGGAIEMLPRGRDLARSFVSVLIDTYNHERFIAQAIMSALEGFSLQVTQ
jgi:hypothetical protein